MNIYNNLAARVAPWKRAPFGLHLLRAADGAIEVITDAWQRDWPGQVIARVDRDQRATYLLREPSNGANLVFGELGLGAVTSNTSVRARTLFWLHGKAWLYHTALVADLAQGSVIDGVAYADTAVDPAKRAALSQRIAATVPATVQYLRVAALRLNQVGEQRNWGNSHIGDFVAALDAGDTYALAILPLRYLRWSSHKNAPCDPLHLCYPGVLKRYLEQNRALLYQATGVTIPGAPR